MDFQKLADDLGFEMDEFKELVELFVDTALADAEKALSAVDENDAETAARAAHSIKGASGNLGFMEIHEAAKKLEAEARVDRLEGMDASLHRLKGKIHEVAAALSP